MPNGVVNSQRIYDTIKNPSVQPTWQLATILADIHQADVLELLDSIEPMIYEEHQEAFQRIRSNYKN